MVQLLRNFRFQITLRQSAEAALGSAPRTVPSTADSGDSLGDGGFQECSGLDLEMDVQSINEGGRNDGVIQRAGRAKYSPIVLKRGMFYGDEGSVNADVWSWLQDAVSGVRPIRRYDGVIEVMSVGQEVAATWVFERGLPSRVSGPTLNAKSGDVAIEELTIAHQGLKLVQE